MARKNMFDGLTPAATPDPDATRPPLRGPEVFQQAGPIAAIRQDLRNLGSRSVQEISVDLIEDTGLKDRLGDLEEDIAELRDSIARHGQQVPILLRPHPSLSGRFQVVYGRRRLAALRGLGQTVKALIRTLTDEEAVLAQGQENSLRKDPSFIEKTLFAGDLEEAGYEPRVIQDALNVSRSHTSHMRKVREAFPRSVIDAIGPAPSVGWKRWYDAALRLLDAGVPAASVHPLPFPAGSTSDQRFQLWMSALEKALAQPRPVREDAVLRSATGAPFGALSRRGNSVTFRAERSSAAFADWLEANGEVAFRQLFEQFQSQSSATATKT